MQNIVIDTIKESGYEEHLHFGHTLLDITVIQVSKNVDLLPTNANLTPLCNSPDGVVFTVGDFSIKSRIPMGESENLMGK